MKSILNATIPNRVAVFILVGCLLLFGYIIFHQINQHSTSNKLHPSGLTNKEVHSPIPIETPAFTEPSLKRLVEQLKAELGDVSETVDAEKATGERFLNIANHMDDRRTPAAVDAAGRERKRKVIANPDLLWQPGFVLPPYLDMLDERHAVFLFDYEVKHEYFKESKSQEKRKNALRDKVQKGEILDEEYYRKWMKITTEGKDFLTVAKYIYTHEGIPNVSLGIEYAERALQKNPNSFEALHVWTLCHVKREEREAGYRKVIEKFPNSGIAHWEYAIELIFPSPWKPAEALEHMQKAIQLDNRIPSNNAMLALCYKALGEHEKALAVYQGMRAIHRGQIGDLYGVQDPIYKKRMQNPQE